MNKISAAALALCLQTAVAGTVLAQQVNQASAKATVLTALDYIEIEQLMNKYAHALDTCFNDGYDYADLYTDDGEFIDKYTDEAFAKGGASSAKGREALARAAGGGSDGCSKPTKGPISTPGDGSVAWNGWSHLMVNHVITPTPEGASGRVYLVMLGMSGPGSTDRDGGYEDTYVKTPAGWRIKTRAHVRTREWHNPLLLTPDYR